MKRIFVSCISHPFILPAIIACFAALAVVIQTTRVTPLTDYTHQVEQAYRIYRGQVPYRDFFLMLPPGTYIIFALLMIVTGGYSHAATVLFTAILAGLSVLLVNKILILLRISPAVRLPLLAILPLTGHGIIPWPNYDVYSGIIISVLFYWLLRIAGKNAVTPWFAFRFGFACAVPALFKQNTGLAFSAGIIIIFLLSALRFREKLTRNIFFSLLAGMLMLYLLFGIALVATRAMSQFLYQTVEFSGEARQPLSALGIIAGQYLSYFIRLFRFLPVVLVILFTIFLLGRFKRLMSFANTGILILLIITGVNGVRMSASPKDQYSVIVLMSWVTVYIVCAFVLPLLLSEAKSFSEYLLRLFPVVLIVTAHAAYISHHIVGSSYGIWPFYLIIIGTIFPRLQKLFPRLWLAPLTALSCGLLLYALFVNFEKRQMFDYVRLDGAVEMSRTPRLAGAGTPGQWMGEFDRLIDYVNANIPAEDPVMAVPGEDPFYSVTGRLNPTPVLGIVNNGYPIVGVDFPKLLAQKHVTWIIAKNDLQSTWDRGYIDLRNPGTGISRYYTFYHQVGIYTILKRNDAPVPETD